MAEQAAGAVASAVVNGITDRALTTVMRKLRSRSRSAAAHEKLQRLETLVLKLRCAVEVSEKHAIESASLLQWRNKLRDAAAESGAVVLDFQRRAREDGDADADAAATSASSSAPGQQQQEPAAATTSSTGTYLYFTRSALCGMAQRVRDAARRLFSTDEDMKKLDGALEKMERLSPDLTQFLWVLHLEVAVPVPLSAEKRVPPPPPPPIPGESTKRRKVSEGGFEPSACGAVRFPLMMRKCSVESRNWVQLWNVSEHRPRKAVTSSETTQQLALAEAEEAVDPESEARILGKVLEPSLQLMESFVKATEGKDMGGLEWLAEWAALLRETVERGNAVLKTLCPGSDVIHKASFGSLDREEDGGLYSFVRAVEQLARYEKYKPWPCSNFRVFSLSSSHQFLVACIEH